MERIEDLIHKLTTQQASGETPAQLLATVQQLQSALLKVLPVQEAFTGKKVSVVLPTTFIPKTAVAPVIVAEEKQEGTVMPAVEAIVSPPMPEPAPFVKEEVLAPEPYMLKRPVIEEVAIPISTPTREAPAFDPIEEVPTLRQQAPVQKELHELLGEKGESLNDRLKGEKTELAQSLKNEPIKDLRKGIGVNDKFLFINELFRGDEAMYERSIKTINAFHILPEAEYWINRELKVKLGWSDTKDTVQHFYQVVRRRFS
ncbi:MAG: hypothetical protein JWP88_814 [Flaviaesturariibacter sp.]|nr:hypothetical protein [Flaviaesturariibacter sp.]